MSNGLAWDREGRCSAEHATSRLTRTEADGTVTVLASAYEGKELNSPNDVVVKSDGGIYFTDPAYGRMEYYGVPRAPQSASAACTGFEPDGRRLTLLADDFGQPNGLCFSADERRLFVNDTERGHIRVFDVLAGGVVGNGRIWTTLAGEAPGAPDGMKIDSEENLDCCGPGRHPRLRPRGQLPRRDQGARRCRELHLGRGRPAEPLHHRERHALPGAGARARPRDAGPDAWPASRPARSARRGVPARSRPARRA